MAKVDYTLRKVLSLTGTICCDFYKNQIGKHFKALRPTVIVLNVDYRCDARCIMCSNWQRGSEHEINIEEYDRIFQDPLYKNIENVNISGGEPTLRKDLPKIVELCHRWMPKLKKIGISSTGINNYAIPILEEIARFCHQRQIELGIRISIDGIDEKHDEMRRIPHAYEKAMKTVHHLKALENELDFSIGLSVTFSGQNYEQCDKIHEMTSSLGLDTVYAPAVISEESYHNDTSEIIMLPPEGKTTLLRFYKERIVEGSLLNGNTFFYTKYIKYLRCKGKIERNMPCPFADQGIVIEPDGDLKYCLNSHAIGNAVKKTSSEIYYDKENIKKRSEFPSTICRDCLLPCFTLVSARKQIFPYLAFVKDAIKTKLQRAF